MAASTQKPPSVYERLLENHLTCAVCMEIYTNPQMLPCHHTFCLECIENLRDAVEAMDFPCPTCRAETYSYCSDFSKEAMIADIKMSTERTADNQGDVNTNPTRFRTPTPNIDETGNSSEEDILLAVALVESLQTSQTNPENPTNSNLPGHHSEMNSRNGETHQTDSNLRDDVNIANASDEDILMDVAMMESLQPVQGNDTNKLYIPDLQLITKIAITSNGHITATDGQNKLKTLNLDRPCEASASSASLTYQLLSIASYKGKIFCLAYDMTEKKSDPVLLTIGYDGKIIKKKSLSKMEPTDIAVNPKGTVYITSFSERKILRKLHSRLKIQDSFSTWLKCDFRPNKICCNSQEEVIAAGVNGDTTYISKFNNKGQIIWMNNFLSQSICIGQIVCDHDGNVIFTNMMSDTVSKLNKHGKELPPVVTPADNITKPRALALYNNKLYFSSCIHPQEQDYICEIAYE